MFFFKKLRTVALLTATTAMVLGLAVPAKAQFEFAPIVGVGTVMDTTFEKAGFTTDLGISARYTFLKDAPLSIQVRLDAQYSYLSVGTVRKNLIQHARFNEGGEYPFGFKWQDHIFRLPLTVGVRFNNVLDGRVTLRAGGYYGRGITGSVGYIYTPANLTFPQFNSYESQTFKGNSEYDGNFMTLAQNEHRLGFVVAVDVNVYKQLDLSLYYMGDVVDSWSFMKKPYVIPKSLKLGLSYWF